MKKVLNQSFVLILKSIICLYKMLIIVLEVNLPDTKELRSIGLNIKQRLVK